MSKSPSPQVFKSNCQLTIADYVVAVIAIFAIFLIALWLGKRNHYSGPQFDVIMGTNMPVTEADARVEEKVGEPTKQDTVSSSSNSEGNVRPVSASK
jgi:hypothetical protein